MPTDKLLLGHQSFKKMFADDQELFVRLAKAGQSPEVLWIGCSDSRVVPEQITGVEAGELFMVRNIANVVPPSGSPDDAIGAVIEYAVLHLEVSHIVVCGHTDCGGIKALEGHTDVAREPHLARWLELARPARAQVETLGLPKEARYLETIKRNVLLQCGNVQSYDCVREREREGKLRIHGWLYDLHTGDLLAHDNEGTWGALTTPGARV